MARILDTIAPFLRKAPVNIEEMIRAVGIDLDKKAELDPEIAGQIERLDDGAYRISVNRADHYYRQRFTMAHELGHWFMHRDLIGSGVDDTPAYRSTNAGKFYNVKIRREHETEANQIAASLLMPADLVRSEFAKDTDPASLAKRFQVSKAAMEIRLKGLDLLA